MRIRNKGFSIIEVLMALAITAIVAFSVVTLMRNQNKEMTAMTEKFVAKEAEIFIAKMISSEDYCQCYFSGKILNMGARTWTTPLSTSLPSSYSNTPVPCAAVGAPYLQVGQNIYRSKVRVADIRMENITEIVVGSGNFSGDFVVEMDSAGMIRAIKNISAKMIFNVDATTGVFKSCSSSSSMKLPEPELWEIGVPRSSSREISTPPDMYNFCTLTWVGSGGGDGGGSDRCEVNYVTATRQWRLSGRRGDDPLIFCKMYCYK